MARRRTPNPSFPGGVKLSTIVLGLETSCDETAAGLVLREADGRGRLLANVVSSQMEEHAPFGGVVPEIAARSHAEAIDKVVRAAFKDAGLTPLHVDAVAATAGPGLVGGLMVGLTTGKAMALALHKPFVAVNHLEAHALTPRLLEPLAFPYLLLLVSGGHCQLLAVLGVGHYKRLGTTVDDAVGEAFDKVAKMLGLGYPGGPLVEHAALSGSATRFSFPRPMMGRPTADFSFAGLKTAVRQEAESLQPLSKTDVCDLCASFQAAVVDVMCERVRTALRHFTDELGFMPHALVVAGGVAANGLLQSALKRQTSSMGLACLFPPLDLCGDNGAMVAWAGAERLALGLVDTFDAPVRPRWPLDERYQLAGMKA